MSTSLHTPVAAVDACATLRSGAAHRDARDGCRLIVRFRSLFLAAALMLGAVGTAEAHAHLKTAAPAAGSSVATAPAELRLGFSEGVNIRFTGVAVTGPAGAPVPTGAAVLLPGDDKVLVVPVAGPLSPGAYKVDWHAVATDAHKTEGSYGFTVGP